jgi:preprotein translocase subunit SecA
MRPTILRMVEEEMSGLVDTFVMGPDREEWDLNALASAVTPLLPPDTLPRNTLDTWRQLSRDEILDDLIDRAHSAYDERESRLGLDQVRLIERLVMLRSVDNRWVRHLTDLDVLREGIGLRAFGQQDPLIAYKREAHEMYQDLLGEIQHDIVQRIYHAHLKPQPARPMRAVRPGGGGGQAPQPIRSSGARPGRNEPCWCGSGKKYKLCHMREDQQGHSSAQASEQRSGRPAQQHKSSSSQRRKRRRRRR